MLEHLQRVVGYSVDVGVERVALRVELQPEHAVAQVVDAGRGVALELARRVAVSESLMLYFKRSTDFRFGISDLDWASMAG